MSGPILQFTPRPVPLAADALMVKVDALLGQATTPFHKNTLAMLGDLSRRLLKSPLARTAPQLTVAGYWLRPAALKTVSDDWQKRVAPGCLAAPRGIAFHLPPANVDTLFLYSWALSVLAGNCNIVRLPSTLTPVGEVILNEIMACLAEHNQQERHIFVHFDHAGPLAADLSAKSDLRLIWGGDAKVADASRHILMPDGLSLGFPDRFSFATIRAAAWLDLDEVGRTTLATNFYNDMFWFDQLGCGSPRILYWIGNECDASAASETFFATLDAVIEQKAYESEVGTAIAKFTWATRRAAQGDMIGFKRISNALMVVEPTSQAELHGDVQGGGMLAQMTLQDLLQVAPRIRRKDQTMTHFGFDHEKLANFASQASTRGLCRIVPIGQALAFEPIWDGLDLLSYMTRLISLRL
jgi:Acyl-CoA reductase (LuxC)